MAKELHLTFEAIAFERRLLCRIETGNVNLRFDGMVETEHPVETCYNAVIVYFPSSKRLHFEFQKRVGGELLPENTFTGFVEPGTKEVAQTVERAILKEFPLIGPALMVGLRSYFRE